MKRVLSLLLLAITVLAGCTPAPSAPTTGGRTAPEETRSANQTLRIAQSGLPASLSPEASAANPFVYAMLYDNLVAMDAKYNVIPWAAQRWEQPNPTTWRLHLRRDLVFTNGDPVTAADVEFTIKFFFDRKTPQSVQLATVSDVKAVDDYTVDVFTRIPDASALTNLGYVWIMPKKYFEKVGREGFVASPLGSGPYEMVDFRSGDSARFRLRSTAHSFRKPVATEVTVRSIPQVTSTIAGIRTGDIDIAIGQFTGDQLETLSKADVVFQKRLSGNLSGLFPFSETEERQLPTRDRRVRQALNYAVDKETLARSFYRGEAVTTGQLGLPDSPFWDPAIQPYPYDPKKAKELLAQAGYPNGFKLPNGIEFTTQTANPDMMVAIQSNFRDVGVEIAITPVELGAFLDKIYNRNGQTKGDLFVAGLPDANGFATVARGYYTCDRPANEIWWCNREFDRLTGEMINEPDLTKRRALGQRAAQAIAGDVPNLYLLATPMFIGSNAKLRGFDWTANTFYNFDAVYRVD